MSGRERCDTVMKIIDEALADYERSLAPLQLRPEPAPRRRREAADGGATGVGRRAVR